MCLMAAAATATPNSGSLTRGGTSGTIEDTESGSLLDYTVHGGSDLTVTEDGWDHRIEGTARPGETISIAASGHGTTWTGRHHVNEDNEATLQIRLGESSEKELTTIAPGSSGSLSARYVVSDDDRSVEGYVVISNTWINPYGGGSRTLRVDIDLDVVEPTTTTTSRPQTSAAPRTTTPSDEDCDEKKAPGVVRFGDLTGEVDVRPNCYDDDAYIFAVLSTPLYHDYRIRTLPQSGAILSFSDMMNFVMSPDSTIVLDTYERPIGNFEHVAGNVWINLKKMVEDGSMEVEMAQAVAGIKGTILRTEQTDNTSTVKVFEGVVDLRPNNGPSFDVGPGEMVVVTDGRAGPVEKFDRDAEIASWDEVTRNLVDKALAEDRAGGGTSKTPIIAIGIGAALLALVTGIVVSRRKASAIEQPQATQPPQPTQPPQGSAF